MNCDTSTVQLVAPSCIQSAEISALYTIEQAAAKLAEMPPYFHPAISAAKAARPTMRYGAAYAALAPAFEGTPDSDELRIKIAREIVELVSIVCPDDHAYISLGPNPILTAAMEFVAKCREYHMSDEHDVVTDNWADEGPILHGPAVWGEGAAALCMAAFGSDLVPDLDAERTGCAAQEALQIANVYLSEPVTSPLRLAMEALSLVVRRYQTEGPDDEE